MNPFASRNLNTVRFDSVEQWDDFVEAHRLGSVFHSKAMLQAFCETASYDPFAIAAVDENGAIAGLLVANRVSTLGSWAGSFGARSLQFAEPLCVDGELGDAALDLLLTEHDQQVKDQVVFSEIRPLFPDSERQAIFERHGYDHFNYNNYEHSLDCSTEELFKRLGPKRRNNVRSNERKGLTVRTADPQTDLDTFYDHLRHSFERSQIPLVNRDHFRSVFHQLPPEWIRLSIAEFKGTPVASACHLVFGGRVFCWYAGTKRIPGVYAQVSLVWDAMRWGIESGHQVYDFAGAGWEGETYGPGTFKSRFGAQHVNVGRYRKVVSSWRLKVAQAGYQLSRSMWGAGATRSTS